PYVTWISVKSENFRWTRGEPKVHASSAKATRLFCPDCGSQLAFRFNDKPHLYDITAGTLDDPAKVTPKENIYWDTRIPAHITANDLPERRIEG
ncbi:MAG: GFA family protein, partial [Alphaproteobacteria bacterium]|nr:GFA family protein [Alphaproteobacteria bacterium]